MPLFKRLLGGRILPLLWLVAWVVVLLGQGVPCGWAADTAATPPLSDTRVISRAQFANLLVQTLHYDPPYVSEFPFYRDVPLHHWAYRPVEVLREKGIFNGLPGGFYHPEASLTKLDAFLTLSNALRRSSLSAEDVDGLLKPLQNRQELPEWAEMGVAKLIAAEILPLRPNEPKRIAFQDPMTLQELQPLLSALGDRLNLSQPVIVNTKPAPALPADLSLTITPTAALRQDRLGVGSTVYFMTTEEVRDPNAAAGAPVLLPRSSRLKGSVTTLQAGHLYFIQFTQVQTPAGESFQMDGQLALPFTGKPENAFVVPGQLFQVQTLAPPATSIAP